MGGYVKVLVCVGVTAGVALVGGPAGAHGALEFPLSRVLGCYQENPENPSSAACKAAVAAGGAQQFYDWNGVRIGDAAGRHRQVVPDGRLCSAGNPAFRGLDLARADWPATRLKAGADYTFKFRVTAVHKGGFELFITRDGYDASKPLTWADLESEPFVKAPSPTASGGYYQLSGRVPAGKTGRHLIYAIWQRTDSPEAFYSCSDVVLGAGDSGSAGNGSAGDGGSGNGGGTTAPGGGTGGGATVTPTAAPSQTPSAKPTRPGKPKPKPTESCPPAAAAHDHHGAAALSDTTPAAGTSALSGQDPKGVALITGAVGLALGGVAGLLLTARRRPATHAKP
ncbi:lytic polysaccharide monooxygenase [Actinocorallia sp. A-T 12471]|uniref:lytic polysaccharide monooxygenase auxiliary activity family 9 protein n=1 Tax=Actinocorallia sp. A-T 12471 TaxID=3089813 RepID=UPI0029CB1889|nr:lytic polysaccharide monooxygenase [Actinocorallia sp. A-T 12471]MDX6741994.1 lytic polysaccharide monooxygenase [Actinocorallia sp. A-T 12471]